MCRERIDADVVNVGDGEDEPMIVPEFVAGRWTTRGGRFRSRWHFLKMAVLPWRPPPPPSQEEIAMRLRVANEMAKTFCGGQ